MLHDAQTPPVPPTQASAPSKRSSPTDAAGVYVAPAKLARRHTSLQESASGTMAPMASLVKIPHALRSLVDQLSSPAVLETVKCLLEAATNGTGRDVLTVDRLTSLVHAYLQVCLGPCKGCVCVGGERIPLAYVSAEVVRTLYRLTLDVTSSTDVTLVAAASADSGADEVDSAASADSGADEVDSGAEAVLSVPQRKALRWCILPLIALLHNDVSAFGGALTPPDDDDHHQSANLPIAFHWLQLMAASNPHMLAQLHTAKEAFTHKLAAAANAKCTYTGLFCPF
jgi:hypothetical protein